MTIWGSGSWARILFSKTMTLNIFPTVAWTMCDTRNFLEHSTCMCWSLYDVVRRHNIVSLFTIAICRIRQSQESLTTLQVSSHPESWTEYRFRLEGGMPGCQSMEHVVGCYTMCKNVNNYPTCQIFDIMAMRSLSFGHVTQHKVKAQPQRTFVDNVCCVARRLACGTNQANLGRVGKEYGEVYCTFKGCFGMTSVLKFSGGTVTARQRVVLL